MVQTMTIDLLPSLEQGYITRNGDAFSNDRVRTSGYISYPLASNAKIKLFCTAKNGNRMQVHLMLYNSSSSVEYAYDYGTYDSPHSYDVSGHPTINYFRADFRYYSGSYVTPDAVSSCYAEIEYEYTWSVGADGYPTTEKLPAEIEHAMEVPYPKGLWRVENGDISHELLPPEVELGAFANATNLRQVSIPRSCKKIGRVSFRNTQLTSVTIARDCEYYPTSFPAGCVVNYYPD